jgi:hypothetical protein
VDIFQSEGSVCKWLKRLVSDVITPYTPPRAVEVTTDVMSFTISLDRYRRFQIPFSDVSSERFHPRYILSYTPLPDFLHSPVPHLIDGLGMLTQAVLSGSLLTSLSFTRSLADVICVRQPLDVLSLLQYNLKADAVRRILYLHLWFSHVVSRIGYRQLINLHAELVSRPPRSGEKGGLISNLNYYLKMFATVPLRRSVEECENIEDSIV